MYPKSTSGEAQEGPDHVDVNSESQLANIESSSSFGGPGGNPRCRWGGGYQGRVLQDAVNTTPHGPYSSPEGSVAGSEGYASAAGPQVIGA